MFHSQKLKKFFVMFVILLLVLPDISAFAAISNEDNLSSDETLVDEQYYLYSEEVEQANEEEEITIPIYSVEAEDENSILANLPLFTEIEIINLSEVTEDNDFLHIRFQDELDKENPSFLEGYVKKEFVYSEEALLEIATLPADDSEKNSEETKDSVANDLPKPEDKPTDSSQENQVISKEEDNVVEEEAPTDSEKTSTKEESTVEELSKVETSVQEEGKEKNEGEQTSQNAKARTFSTFSMQAFSTATVASQTSYRGVALQDRTNVYKSTSTSSEVLKSYAQGSVLLYRSYNDNWYEATVYVNGKRQTGYIHKNHVLNANDTKQQNLKGAALKNPTRVYKTASTNADAWKSYSVGSVLHYRTFSNNWYQATVYVNGKKQTGYIHKDHVANANNAKQQNLEGIAKNNPTRVYKTTATNAGTWKSYSSGSILKYRTFSDNWYQATVYVNGKRQTGYIHKNHVENAVEKQQNLEGIAKNNPTRVYKAASTSSSTWKSYSQGSILKYRTYAGSWYQATVYVNGKRQTGYIHKNHVQNAVEKQQNLEGIAKNNPTRVYKAASTSSGSWKSYSQGSILKYRTYAGNWYQATVYVNGKRQTGYIHKNHVENAVAKQQSYQGVALRSPTTVYKHASTKLGSWKIYKIGSMLHYRSYSSNWYQATVYVEGKKQTGYIHKSHVENKTKNLTTVTMYAAKNPTPAYISASRSSKVIKGYDPSNKLKLQTFSNDWYQATVYNNGVKYTAYFHRNDVSADPIHRTTTYNLSFSSFVDIQVNSSPKADGAGHVAAGRNLVAYYANPANFPVGTSGFYQFLDLTSPAGLNAKEVNQKILKNAGTLTGMAEAFIKAGKQYNINEAYLIAHALHETGNGTSTLAKGVKYNGKTVYNVYGIKAFDDTPVQSGSKHAYEQGWFTPEAAIIGGAKFIGEDYIHRSPNQQNTLYKMRWNPERPGTHQYATHVAWASITANRIANIYSQLDEFVEIFEVPRFNNQPDYQGPTPPPNIIDIPENLVGETTGTNVRFRTAPNTTNSSIITTIRNSGTKLELIELNNGWYKVRYDGKVGWISADYVKPINLLEVTASGLNIRRGPGTNHETVGSVSNGNLLAGVLDNNYNLVKQNEWYQIHFNGGKYWTSSGSNHSYLKPVN